MNRPTRVVLWRSIVPPIRNRRRVHRGSHAAGSSNPRSLAAGTRGLSRHPGITAHRAVHVTGPIEGRTVLVQGGAGAVGACAVQLAHRAGARVIASCRSESDKEIASRAGADEVLLIDERFVERILELAPNGVDHIVEVAFGANIKLDV